MRPPRPVAMDHDRHPPDAIANRPAALKAGMDSPMSRRAAVARPRLRSFPVRRAAWLSLIAPAILLLGSAYAMWATYSPSLYADQWVDLARWRAAARTGWLAYLFSLNN